MLLPQGGREELKGNEVEEAVEAAIDAGYRHVDTAAIYSTEEQVGPIIVRARLVPCSINIS